MNSRTVGLLAVMSPVALSVAVNVSVSPAATVVLTAAERSDEAHDDDDDDTAKYTLDPEGS